MDDFKQYKSFTEISPEEQQKFLASPNIRAVEGDDSILEILMEAEQTWIRVAKTEIHNKAWGLRETK